MLTASLFLTPTARAQDPYSLLMFDQVIYYGMYQETVNEPVQDGMLRKKNWCYTKKLTQEQLDSFGDDLKMVVVLNALCDNYDRIGNVNMVMVPKGATDYNYDTATRIELGRFITPFMNKNVQPNEVPYMFDIDHITKVMHDTAITTIYDLWIELEVYGYQGGPGQGGAAVEIPGCAGRSDVYMGSLEFQSEGGSTPVPGAVALFPMSHKYELKNYTLAGTDVLGETIRTINVTLEAPVTDATLYIITSNHGANSGGEEYIRRNHFIYFDDAQVLMYKPGGLSCEPFRPYNTQANGIYTLQPRPLWQWQQISNWCPGDKIPIRSVSLGSLSAGTHSFRIEVPDATFNGGQGYFPMSVYLQGVTAPLSTPDFSTKEFSIYPNPVSDVATISSIADINHVNVFNTLGQVVVSSNGKELNLSSLNSGMYMVQVQFADNTTATRKIVKN